MKMFYCNKYRQTVTNNRSDILNPFSLNQIEIKEKWRHVAVNMPEGSEYVSCDDNCADCENAEELEDI